MVSMLRQNIMSLVFVYLLMTALVVGSWYRESYDGVHEGLGLVDLGYSLSNALGISSGDASSSALPSSVSKDLATGSEDILDDWVISSAAKRSINSVESQDGGEVGETQVEALLSERAEASQDAVQGLRGSIPQLYHSPKVLALNYKEMMEKFKIFVYPFHNESKYDFGLSDMTTEEDAVEPSSSSSISDFFFKTLIESEVVTEDPEEAQLFFLPVSIDQLLNDLDLDKVGLQLRRYVGQTREQYEYWNRTLGADHFYLSCHGFPEDGHRNFLELRKNAIQVACTPLHATQGFFPHKDIVMPPYRPIRKEDSSASFEGTAKKQALRTTLVYYNDPFGDDDPALQSTLEDWKADLDFDIESESLELPQYYKKLGTSRFCLSITPYETLDLVDCLRLGCVPILISSSGFSDLPFQDILNWEEFSVVLELKDIRNLKHMLTGITIAEYQRMQYLGQQASKHMEWNADPLPYDAFHMILYELWLRQYCIRYAHVSSQ